MLEKKVLLFLAILVQHFRLSASYKGKAFLLTPPVSVFVIDSTDFSSFISHQKYHNPNDEICILSGFFLYDSYLLNKFCTKSCFLKSKYFF